MYFIMCGGWQVVYKRQVPTDSSQQHLGVMDIALHFHLWLSSPIFWGSSYPVYNFLEPILNLMHYYILIAPHFQVATPELHGDMTDSAIDVNPLDIH